MKRLVYLVILSMAAMLVFVPTAWAQGQEITVSMEDDFFEPAEVTVEPGTTVTWVQNGDNGHTSTSYDGLWDSGLIDGGAEGSVSYTFDEPGTYEYYCGPHEAIGMVGTVTVSGGSDDSGSDDSTATSSASASSASASMSSMSMSASASATATSTASPDSADLPDTGGFSLPLLAVGTLLGLGILSLVALRRAS